MAAFALVVFATIIGGSRTSEGSTQVASAPTIVVLFVDILPGGNHTAVAERLFASEAAAAKADAACDRFAVLEQSGLPNHYILYSVWRDASAYAAHESSAHTRRLRKRLQPLIGSPIDERLYRRLE